MTMADPEENAVTATEGPDRLYRCRCGRAQPCRHHGIEEPWTVNPHTPLVEAWAKGRRAAELEARVEELEARLAECYRLTGEDPDGNTDRMLAGHAVAAVRALRQEADHQEDRIEWLEGRVDEVTRERDELAFQESRLWLKARREADRAEELEGACSELTTENLRLDAERAKLTRLLWPIAQANRVIPNGEGDEAAVLLPMVLLDEIGQAIGYDEMGG